MDAFRWFFTRFKTTLYLKGKGIRLQLKKRDGHLCIYLKLGYSHKIFLHLPEFCWLKYIIVVGF